MSISTKTGDKGTTGLWSGERTWKDDLRVEAYGTIDELNSFLGEAKHYLEDQGAVQKIETIQDSLFRVAGQLASKSKQFVELISVKDIQNLTSWVHQYEKEVKLSGFVIPGSTLPSAKLDVCRTIARRAERRIISLMRKEELAEEVVQYINRLSDLLFIMARKEEARKDRIQPKKW